MRSGTADMDRDLLTLAGRALYGEQWQSALAAALGVSARTMRRWVAGGSIPARVAEDLVLLLRQRANELRKVEAALVSALIGTN